MTSTTVPVPAWDHYRRRLCVCDEIGLRLDTSRLLDPAGRPFDDEFLQRIAASMEHAFQAMANLEAGAIANPDEGRQVGHYWLRAPEFAPTTAQRDAIVEARTAVLDFATEVHAGRMHPPHQARFTDVLLIGIGGSALGPQLIADALGGTDDRLRLHFFDNTDPDGLQRTLDLLGERLPRTLCVVISKSGGTAETRNGLEVAQAAFRERELDFPTQAVAITGEGSKLDLVAEQEGWLARFPMWDWVGGRTSVLSTVGLLPAALQGLDVDAVLTGAAACDAVTRQPSTNTNPAALLALAWYFATDGQGKRDMVLLPYRDRLLLFSRYLQQLIMESLGKSHDLDGNVVEQGITVYGNKGSTDQHAYVQQLRDGVRNFFVTFLEVQSDGVAPDTAAAVEVNPEAEPGVTSGDYLRGFFLGTREALSQAGRPSITLTIRQLDAYHLGVLIALYERAVGFYASLVKINAYHQPGVEAGKKAAASILQLQRASLEFLRRQERGCTAAEVAAGIGSPERVETVFQILDALAVNGRVGRDASLDPLTCRYHAGSERL